MSDEALVKLISGLLVARFGPIGALAAPFVADQAAHFVAAIVNGMIEAQRQGYHVSEIDKDNPAAPLYFVGPDGKRV